MIRIDGFIILNEGTGIFMRILVECPTPFLFVTAECILPILLIYKYFTF